MVEMTATLTASSDWLNVHVLVVAGRLRKLRRVANDRC